MREFEVYDNVMAEYYEKNSDFILPLNSWEFYGEYQKNFMLFKEDLHALEKLSHKWDFATNYREELLQKNRVIVVTTPKLEIIYATHNMERMNGFTPKEVIGHSPKMFQGKDTCKESRKTIREAVNKKIPFEVSILNYRKDKTSYQCMIKGFPIKNKKGKLINYIAFEEAA